LPPFAQRFIFQIKLYRYNFQLAQFPDLQPAYQFFARSGQQALGFFLGQKFGFLKVSFGSSLSHRNLSFIRLEYSQSWSMLLAYANCPLPRLE